MDWEQFFSTTDIRVLLYLRGNEGVRYSQLLDHIEARSMLSRALRDLQKRNLVQRIVEQTHPIQTKYKLTDKGLKAVEALDDLYEVVM